MTTAIAITSPVNVTIPADRLAVSLATFERLATERFGALRVPQTDLEVIDAETDAFDDDLRAAARAAINLLDEGHGAWVVLPRRANTTPSGDRWIRVEAGDWMAID